MTAKKLEKARDFDKGFRHATRLACTAIEEFMKNYPPEIFGDDKQAFMARHVCTRLKDTIAQLGPDLHKDSVFQPPPAAAEADPTF